MDRDDAVARLAALGRILDDADSLSILEDLARSALVIVPSSLAVIIVVDGQPGPLAAVSERYGQVDASANSSLRFEFTGQSPKSKNQQSHRLIFLAEASDAFSGLEELRVTAVSTPAALKVTPTDPRHRLTGIVINEDLEVGDSTGRPPGTGSCDRSGTWTGRWDF